MIAAVDGTTAERREAHGNTCGRAHYPSARASLVGFLRPADLVIANDAATLPASLQGLHLPSGKAIEVRLAGRRSLEVDDVQHFMAIVFGEGDFRTRTEDRPAPPRLNSGDRFLFGSLSATITKVSIIRG
jgi:S-adenosylmethionine:tRNA ribosyltransferase-isomerase